MLSGGRTGAGFAREVPVESLQPLGDQGALASFADEQAALRWAAAVRGLAAPWLVDVVQAYTTVAVYFDLDTTTFAEATRGLPPLATATGGDAPLPSGLLHRIPCCYTRQLDLERVAAHTGLRPEEVIALHAGTEYTVYAIGFCPGFPYLGYLPGPLCGVPRLPAPRLRVPAGSVGLTGRQTGLYPLERPGGWNLIGQTPLCLVDVAGGYFPLRTGDRVRFVPIDEDEFRRLEGLRLESARNLLEGAGGGG
jgi:inhibitor of KinA